MIRTPSSRLDLKLTALALFVSGPLLAGHSEGGCGGDEHDSGEGTLRVTAYGEPFIEEGIPASMLADGWALTFDHVDATVADISLGRALLSGPYTVDLATPTEGSGTELATTPVAAGHYDAAAWRLESLRVEGSATKGPVTKTFAWTFEQKVDYSGCDNHTVIEDGASKTLQLTFHADHLLVDSLVSEAPDLRFDAIAAADSDGDGAVTQAELTAAALGNYDIGNNEVSNLWDYLAYAATTVGHIDGEGHCEMTPVSE